MQPEKALCPIEVTVLGTDTEVRELHREKAYCSMDVKLEGLAKTTEDRAVHPEKALWPMDVTEVGIVTDFMPH